MLVWRQSTSLIVVLALCATSAIVTGDSKPQNVQTAKSTNATPSATSLSQRKMDVDRQAGGLAGPMFLGLASMLFPVLPVLLLAPLAMGGFGPVMNFLGGSNANEQSSSSQFGEILNTLGGGNNGNNNGGGLGGGSGSALSSLLGGGNQEPSSAASTLSGIAQLMGLGGGNSGSESSSSTGGLLSSLLGGGGSSGPSTASLLNTLFSSDSGSSSGSSSSLFGGGSSGSSVFGNTAAGSRPVPSIALPPNRNSQQQSGVSGMSAADLLGAAAAALDNAGVLGSLGSLGALSGSSSGSALSQLLNTVAGGMASGGGGSNGGGNSLFGGNQKQPITASSNALSDILSGISSNLVGQPAQSASPGLGTQKLPPLGSSLSSNIIQGLPMNGAMLHQNLNAASGTYANANSFNSPSASSSASGALTSLLGLGNSGQSGSFQKLANNALNSITNFLFSKRRQSNEWIPSIPTLPAHYQEFLADNASKTKGGIIGYFRDAFSTLKDGVRRYEISEADCQARLICEVNQKAMGRSFKSWTTTVLDVLGVENYLERSAFSARTKSVMKDFYHAARNGFSEKDCAITYSKCPVAVAVEPLRNSVFSKIIGRPQHPAHVPRPQPMPMLYSIGPSPKYTIMNNNGVESKTGGQVVPHHVQHHQQQQPSINAPTNGGQQQQPQPFVGNVQSQSAPQASQPVLTGSVIMEPVAEIKAQSQPIQYHPSVNVPNGHHQRLH